MKSFCRAITLGMLVLLNMWLVTGQNSSFAGLDRIKFENSMLNAINEIRRQHANTPFLRLENDLTASAQSYADKLAASNSGVSRDQNVLQECGGILKSEYQVDSALNSGSTRCGESLAVASGNDLNKDCNPEIFAQIWNAQRLYYNYTFPPNNSMNANRFADFTQLIW